MSNVLLVIVVLGTVALALAVDVAVVLAWARNHAARK